MKKSTILSIACMFLGWLLALLLGMTIPEMREVLGMKAWFGIFVAVGGGVGLALARFVGEDSSKK